VFGCEGVLSNRSKGGNEDGTVTGIADTDVEFGAVWVGDRIVDDCEALLTKIRVRTSV
jgi:hypothetical protein